MKKSIFSSILIIFISLTLVIVTPLVSSADTVWLENTNVWSIPTGNFNSNVIHSLSNTYIRSLTYDSSTGWSQLNYTNSSNAKTQLPSPFLSNSSVQLSFTHYYPLTSNTNVNNALTLLSFDFSGGFHSYLNSLNMKSGDYLCFAQLVNCFLPIDDVSYYFSHIVTGNSFEPLVNIDERFLVYNPNGVSGVTTSSIITPSLWSSPIGGGSSYNILFYFNVAYDDLIAYDNFNDINAITIGFDFTYSTTQPYFRCFEPVIYKASLDADVQTVTYLNNIDNNVQIISDVLQQGTYNTPSSYSDLSNAISHGGGNLDSKIVGALNNDDIWSALSFSYVLSGATWVGTYLAQYYNGIPFLEGIYALILFFMICALLKNGALFKINRGDSGGSKHHKGR